MASNGCAYPPFECLETKVIVNLSGGFVMLQMASVYWHTLCFERVSAYMYLYSIMRGFSGNKNLIKSELINI